MPILKNAKKALRSSKRKAVVNGRIKSRMRTAVQAAKKDASPKNISEAYRSIDMAVKGNLIHKNKAARIKSQIAHSAAK